MLLDLATNIREQEIKETALYFVEIKKERNKECRI